MLVKYEKGENVSFIIVFLVTLQEAVMILEYLSLIVKHFCKGSSVIVLKFKFGSRRGSAFIGLPNRFVIFSI